MEGSSSPWLIGLVICSCLAPLSSGYFEEKRKPQYLDGLVGSFVVFNCKITFPLDFPVPYTLHWYKDVSGEVRRRKERNHLLKE